MEILSRMDGREAITVVADKGALSKLEATDALAHGGARKFTSLWGGIQDTWFVLTYADGAPWKFCRGGR
jgi:hypothetical protein